MSRAGVHALKKRSLVSVTTRKSLRVARGEQFANWGKKPASDLTHEMMLSGAWRETVFKPLNLAGVDGLDPSGGALHPLMKVRALAGGGTREPPSHERSPMPHSRAVLTI